MDNGGYMQTDEASALLDPDLKRIILSPSQGADGESAAQCRTLWKEHKALKRGFLVLWKEAKRDRVFREFEDQGLMEEFIKPGTSQRYDRRTGERQFKEYTKEGWGFFYKSLEVAFTEWYEENFESGEARMDTLYLSQPKQVEKLNERLLDAAVVMYEGELAATPNPKFQRPEMHKSLPDLPPGRKRNWTKPEIARIKRERMRLILLQISGQELAKIEEFKAQKQKEEASLSAADTERGRKQTGRTGHNLEGVGRSGNDAPINGQVTTRFDPEIVPHTLIRLELRGGEPFISTMFRNSVPAKVDARMKQVVQTAQQQFRRAGLSSNLEDHQVYLRHVNDPQGVFGKQDSILYLSNLDEGWVDDLLGSLGIPTLAELEAGSAVGNPEPFNEESVLSA